jgi:hypothetical protein
VIGHVLKLRELFVKTPNYKNNSKSCFCLTPRAILEVIHVSQGQRQKILLEGASQKKKILILQNFFIKKIYFCCFYELKTT